MGMITTASGKIADEDVSGELPSRLFRDAWMLNGQAVEIDLEAARAKAHEVRSRWFAWKCYGNENLVSHKGLAFWSDAKSASLIDGEVGYARDVEEDSPGTYSLSPGWKASDGQFLPINSFADIKGLKAAYRDHYSNAFAASESKAAEIQSAPDAGTLEVILTNMLSDIGEN
jgi:hypothetical protein